MPVPPRPPGGVPLPDLPSRGAPPRIGPRALAAARDADGVRVERVAGGRRITRRLPVPEWLALEVERGLARDAGPTTWRRLERDVERWVESQVPRTRRELHVGLAEDQGDELAIVVSYWCP